MRPILYLIFASFAFLNIGCAALLFASPPSSVFSSSEINESSGIIKSRLYPDLFWTHNDSGDTPRIFAIHGDGQLVAEVNVKGAENLDWEDIAAGEPGQIYICDIGNNGRARDDLVIYQIPEPNPKTDNSVTVTRVIRFRYESRSQDKNQPYFDAEACFFASGKIYILTKHRLRTELYRLDISQDSAVGTPTANEEHVAERVSGLAIPGMVTGADLSPDGKRLAVLTYLGIHLFEKPKGGDDYLGGIHTTIDLFFGQSEGITFDGAAVLITNEEGQLLKMPYK